MRRTVWRGLGAAVVSGAVAAAVVLGTGGPERADRAADTSGRLPAAAPAGAPGLAPARDESCHPRQSYRPGGPPPAVGHMPAGSTMAAIVKRGRLIAGVDQNSYLFGYRNPLTGELDGYEIELVRRISTALFGSPDRVQFRTITSAARIPVLTTDPNPVDLVIDSMTINCDRWKQVAFSSDYMDAGQRVLVSSTSNARSVKDLGGKRICAAKETTSIDTLRALRDPSVVAVGVNDWTDCLMLMQLGQVDAASTDDTILIGLAAQDPNTKLIGPRFTDEPHGIAMRPKQTDFVRFVNAVLERMRQDGSLKALAAKWLGGSDLFAPPAAQYRD
ncbi:transporter substrate-binding domain-containing protein [Streptomyces sp. NPDC008139]|uniref:glutamate ABC transporter substrate-binding protein n=1 Tax=Streptomyces sp. NPDC008139 TaxID=3364814 RepID=UPI0036E40590